MRGLALLCLALLTQGCSYHKQPEFILPEQASIARPAAYASLPPHLAHGIAPPPSRHVAPEVHYPQSQPPHSGDLASPDFMPMPNYFPEDGPALQPAPEVELAPTPPLSGDIQQMGGVCCCQRCQQLTAELQQMSQRVDEITAMMETQRLTIESLNAAMLRGDNHVQQLHDELAWHRGELDRLRAEMEDQQQQDYQRLHEIAEIVDRLSAAP